MSMGRSFYGETLFERNYRAYGLHPKCKKCRTLKKKECENPQYAAIGVRDFYCADAEGEQ